MSADFFPRPEWRGWRTAALPADRPENTMAAFEEAVVRQGADAIEPTCG